MSDIDEGEHEGDNAYSERDLSTVDAVFQKELDRFVASTNVEDAVWRAYEVFMTLWADHHRLRTKVQELEGRLETYMKRSAPALSAARMHVPIGGGDSFWRSERARKHREKMEATKERQRARLAARTPAEVEADNKALAELFDSIHVERKPKRVKRKRSKKTTQRK